MKNRKNEGGKTADRVHLQLAGLLDIALDAAKNFRLNGDATQAAAISYYALLSAFPLFILTLLVISYLLGSYPGIQETLIGAIREYHPYLTEKLLTQLGAIEEKKRLLGGLGVISLLWFASLVIRALEMALNRIFHAGARRNLLASTAMALSLMILVWVAALLMVVINYGQTLISLDHAVRELFAWSLPPYFTLLFGHAIPYLIMITIVGFCYKVIPQSRITIGSALAGGVIFTFFMAIAKFLFTWYLANHSRYTIIYGSLDALVVIFIWIFYLSLIFLFCAELVSSYRRRDLILLEGVILDKKKMARKSVGRIYRRFGQAYQPDTYIFKEGDRGKELYYILEGRVQLEKKAGSVKKILGRMGPGEYFGEMAVLVDTNRTVSVLALEPSVIAVIRGDIFRDLLRESGEISLSMLREFARRLKNTNGLLDQLGQSWIRLFAISYLSLKDQGRNVPLNDLPGELAGMAGKEISEMEALVRDLAQRGVLEPEQGDAVGLDRDKARELLKQEAAPLP
ncbi:MAG: YhjD/YihY/BrkB family envelope integrity protein [Smithellaceae bacterium]|nr:YhjD/YihY/BrkB family envelope integrity protein [Smithellaceae bacterium]